jgi:hypothetical protein
MIALLRMSLPAVLLLALAGCASTGTAEMHLRVVESPPASADPLDASALKNARVQGKAICEILSVDENFREPSPEYVKKIYESWLPVYEPSMGTEPSRAFLSKFFLYSAERYCPELTVLVAKAAK